MWRNTLRSVVRSDQKGGGGILVYDLLSEVRHLPLRKLVLSAIFTL